jgi:hypothetical protein
MAEEAKSELHSDRKDTNKCGVNCSYMLRTYNQKFLLLFAM